MSFHWLNPIWNSKRSLSSCSVQSISYLRFRILQSPDCQQNDFYFSRIYTEKNNSRNRYRRLRDVLRLFLFSLNFVESNFFQQSVFVLTDQTIRLMKSKAFFIYLFLIDYVQAAFLNQLATSQFYCGIIKLLINFISDLKATIKHWRIKRFY